MHFSSFTSKFLDSSSKLFLLSQ